MLLKLLAAPAVALLFRAGAALGALEASPEGTELAAPTMSDKAPPLAIFLTLAMLFPTIRGSSIAAVMPWRVERPPLNV